MESNPKTSVALAARTTDALLAQALQQGPETVLLLEPETGCIDWVSDRVVELCGWRPRDLVGRRIQELDASVPEDPDWSLMTASMPLGTAMVVAGRMLCRDGSRRATEVHLTMIEAEGRRVLVAGAREVEARSRMEGRLRERESTLTAVIGALRDGVLVVDTEGIVTLANPRAAELAGLPLHQIIDRPVRVRNPIHAVAPPRPQRGGQALSERKRET